MSCYNFVTSFQDRDRKSLKCCVLSLRGPNALASDERKNMIKIKSYKQRASRNTNQKSSIKNCVKTAQVVVQKKLQSS